MTSFNLRLQFWVSALMLPILCTCSLLPQTHKASETDEQYEVYRNQEIELVKKTIRDPARYERFLQLMSERDQLVSDAINLISGYRQKMWELNSDYDTPKESFYAFVAEYNEQREVSNLAFVAIFSAMKDQTTAEEWETISGFQQKRLKQRQLIYGEASEGD